MTTTTNRPATTPGGRPTRRRALPLVVAVVLAAAAVSFAAFSLVNRSSGNPVSDIRASGIPANVPTSTANLMGLDPVPRVTAPSITTLTDQHGKHFSLSSFRGHPVVLTFFDPHCVTMCPIMAQEFVDAERHLTDVNPSVVFLAVNVNRHALSVATVEAFTKEHQLNTIPTWHFLTATLTTLRRIWSEYGILVKTRIVHGQWTVVHTSIYFFIGPSGKERYVASPTADYGSTPTHRAYLPKGEYPSWARGIALLARDV